MSTCISNEEHVLPYLSKNQGFVHHISMSRKKAFVQEKSKRSDSVLLQKPLHRQKNPKSNLKTQKRHQTFRLQNNCGPTMGGKFG